MSPVLIYIVFSFVFGVVVGAAIPSYDESDDDLIQQNLKTLRSDVKGLENKLDKIKDFVPENDFDKDELVKDSANKQAAENTIDEGYQRFDGRWVCEACGADTKTKQGLKSHYTRVHR